MKVGLLESALALRRAFDASFAESQGAEAEPTEELIAFRVAGDPYALRLRQVAGLLKDQRLTLLPSPLPEFSGVTGIRGSFVPVFGMRSLLGYPSEGTPRWLALIREPELLALAFDAFEGQLSVPHEDVALAGADVRRHVSQAVRTGGLVRQIVDVNSVVATVKASARVGERPREH